MSLRDYHSYQMCFDLLFCLFIRSSNYYVTKLQKRKDIVRNLLSNSHLCLDLIDVY